MNLLIGAIIVSGISLILYNVISLLIEWDSIFSQCVAFFLVFVLVTLSIKIYSE